MVKTLVFETYRRDPTIVLMHGDRLVSTKHSAPHLGVKGLRPCAPDVAERHTGYRVGGTSPFGLRKALPIYAERSIAALERLWINGGQRGLLVSMAPVDRERVLSLEWVDVATLRSAD